MSDALLDSRDLQPWQFRFNPREQDLYIDLVARLHRINSETKSSRWGMKEFEQVLIDSSFSVFLIKHKGSLAGFSVFLQAAPEVHLVNFAVDPHFQRQGLGSALMKFSFSSLQNQGISECWLEVRQSNSSAKAFYSRLGFKYVSTRPGFYQQPDEDGDVMAFFFDPLPSTPQPKIG